VDVALGGDLLWMDRFLAYHSAVLYYWSLVALYVFTPQLAYNFSELIESHAVDTYAQVGNYYPVRVLPYVLGVLVLCTGSTTSGKSSRAMPVQWTHTLRSELALGNALDCEDY
jgi:Alternative oxidase